MSIYVFFIINIEKAIVKAIEKAIVKAIEKAIVEAIEKAIVSDYHIFILPLW